MHVKIELTQRAIQQTRVLRSEENRSFKAFYEDLEIRGCHILGYRLTGEGVIERLCVAHLRGDLRAIVAFTAVDEVIILLVGPHRDDDPQIDVYTELYKLAGLERPPIGKRTKPPCCGLDDKKPPVVESEVVDDLVRRARALSGADRRRESRQRGRGR